MRKSFRQCGPTFVMVTSEFVDKTENVLKDFDHIRVSGKDLLYFFRLLLCRDKVT